MERDKKGRFVKKADLGTTITHKGKSVRPILSDAYEQYKLANPEKSYNDWLNEYNMGHLTFSADIPEPNISQSSVFTDTRGNKYSVNPNWVGTSLNNPIKSSIQIPTFNTQKVQQNPDRYYHSNTPLLGNSSTSSKTQEPEKLSLEVTLNGKKYTVDPKAKDFYNAYKQMYPLKTWEDWLNEYGSKYLTEVSAGMNWLEDPLKNTGSSNNSIIDKTKLADFLSTAHAGLGLSINNKIAKRALSTEKPFLQDVSESHRSIYGDYRAQVQGEQAAAKLRNMAAKPMTSNAALQQQMLLDAQIKGQEYIDQGNAQDEALIKQTREIAWQQEKENQQQRQATAMQNRQALLMSEKNKTNILNSRDSANYSQVIDPYLSGIEKRLRTEDKERKAYQDYYDNATVTKEVWNTFEPPDLTDIQKELRTIYLTEGITGLQTFVSKDEDKYRPEWLRLKQLMDSEVIRRQALIKGAIINSTYKNINNPYSRWESSISWDKKGGTLYKARLTKRTKDNDRASKSIESGKKIAAKLLEKAINSLYDYKDVEIVAKSKKRKYQAGGGLPFVGYTPVFATSETGAPSSPTKTEQKGEDLTTKDILELLKEVDGLPSDIDAINASLVNFIIADDMDPLGLDSSSSIATRYMNLISLIKKAKSNKEWYDKAYDKLRSENSLNEYAVDSTGHFIGMNAEGDFARFTAQQVVDKQLGEYQLLTNSNLLDIRAQYSNAAFNSNLIMEAANGISMDKITEHINKVIQSLGSDKNSTQIFGDQSKEVLAGLKQLQSAAQQIGQDLSISDLYEAEIFTESQVKQAQMALNYLYQTMPTNMKAVLFTKAGSHEGVLELINSLVNSKLSSTNKLEFSPKNKGKGSKTGSGKSGDNITDLELSPAQMLQQGFGDRRSIIIQDATSTGLKVEAVSLPITTGSTGEPIGAGTLEDVATSQYGGILDFNNASMGGQLIPFEGRRNIAIDGSRIYSMYLPIDVIEYSKNNIVPDIALIDKVNAVNKAIRDENITDINEINAKYQEAGLPVLYNQDGSVQSTFYKRFGVINGTAIDNAFGKDFIESRYLKKLNDEDIINNAITIMNKGRSKEDQIEYDSESFFNFGGLLGDYDSVYQGTIFIPIINDIFSGIAGSGKNITYGEAIDLEAKKQQEQRISTYKNPGILQ